MRRQPGFAGKTFVSTIPCDETANVFRHHLEKTATLRKKGGILLVIQNSDLAMSSKRRYSASESNIVSFRLWDRTPSSKAQKSTDALPDASEEKNREGGNSFHNSLEDLIKRMNIGKTSRSVKTDLQETKAQRKLRYHSIDYLFQMLFGKSYTLNLPCYDMSESPLSGLGGSFSREYCYHEEETTSFETTGTVKTSDGREISFHLELSMSRSFTEMYQESFSFGSPDFMDPLVINMDCDAAEVTDQKFFFDLDADGHEEAISRLKGSSGFLALDKNGDGKINDGSELFGTKSGNGFADLSQYDSDGNGWIDEADDIFSKLLIFSPGRNGEDRLVGLGQAGIGAICLGCTETEFSLNNLMTNEAKARIRSTGIFLYENGGVGTMQQLDLAQ